MNFYLQSPFELSSYDARLFAAEQILRLIYCLTT